MFFYIKKMSDLLIPSFFDEQCEQIAQVVHQKWAMWANRSGYSPKMSDNELFTQFAYQKWVTMSELLRLITKNERIAFFLVNRKNERFAQKTDERISSPAKK